jgi:type 2 lantibiotic biosynthesis protein LanM
MQLTTEELTHLVEQASTLPERLSTDYVSSEIVEEKQLTKRNERLARWQNLIDSKDNQIFERRLAWNDIDLSTIRDVVGDVHLVDKQHLPGWAETLNSLLSFISTFGVDQAQTEPYRFVINDEPVPFEELLAPMVCFAQEQLQKQTGAAYNALGSAAMAVLERQLLGQLCVLSTNTLFDELSWFRTVRNPLRLIKIASKTSTSPTGQRKDYLAFTDQLLNGSLKTFFQEYSFLARLVAVTIDLWIEASREFIERLSKDWAIIEDQFSPNVHLRQVVGLEAGLSDPHNGKRSVFIVRFDSGLKLVYKPKTVLLDNELQNFLGWLNTPHDSPVFKTLKFIVRENYGWVEFAEHLPCEDAQAAERFYSRIGSLLCIVYLLNGADCHLENILACGEYPILIDAETLILPQAYNYSDEENSAFSQANQQLISSVLYSGLLPSWKQGNEGHIYNIGGLSNQTTEHQTVALTTWININTDDMELGVKEIHSSPPTGAPWRIENGTKTFIPAGEYITEILDGFKMMYETLLSVREQLLANEGQLSPFYSLPIRFIFRPTETYGLLLEHMFHAKYLRSGIDWSIELEALGLPLLFTKEKNLFWPIIAAEQNAINQLDVPFFTASTNSPHLKLPNGEVINNAFVETAREALDAKVNKLNTKDLHLQLELIQSSFDAFNAVEADTAPSSVTLPIDKVDDIGLTRKALEEQAIRIGEELRHHALWGSDGSATWVHIGYVLEGRHYELGQMDYGLYSGLSGTALFLAALEKATGIVARDLALAALQPIHNNLHKPELAQRFTKQMGIGGLAGVGSLIYAFTRISGLLGVPTLLEDAVLLSKLITAESVTASAQHCIASGTAGALLSLLALYTCHPEKSILANAIACGERLLAVRTDTPSGYRAWLALEGSALTGFSHGAAGISYALLKLYQVTQNTQFLNAAIEGIHYEQALFDSNLNNWPDLRDTKSSFMVSWCHGAPGIGLGRMAGLEIYDTPQVRQDIDAALKTTSQYALGEVDHICCGTLGRLETLLTAGKVLNRPEMEHAALQGAIWVVHKAQQNNGFKLFSNLPTRVYVPNFFQGTAGIGYQLLRMLYPVIIPSILILE